MPLPLVLHSARRTVSVDYPRTANVAHARHEVCCFWVMTSGPTFRRPTAVGSGIAIAQGGYYAVSGLWPLFHMRSFTAVTGPKTDLWLVQSFGLLVAAVGAALLARGLAAKADATTAQFGVATSIALVVIDVWFFLNGAISAVYLADGAAQLVLVGAWAWLLVRRWRPRTGASRGRHTAATS